MKKGEKALIVTTAHKGVFFGYGVRSDASTIELKQARMCVYWSADVKGVLGLAVTGPNKNCKVGPAVSVMTVRDVTAVIEVSEAARQQWEQGPWS